jgi:hypothetical protein
MEKTHIAIIIVLLIVLTGIILLSVYVSPYIAISTLILPLSLLLLRKTNRISPSTIRLLGPSSLVIYHINGKKIILVGDEHNYTLNNNAGYDYSKIAKFNDEVLIKYTMPFGPNMDRSLNVEIPKYVKSNNLRSADVISTSDLIILYANENKQMDLIVEARDNDNELMTTTGNIETGYLNIFNMIVGKLCPNDGLTPNCPGNFSVIRTDIRDRKTYDNKNDSFCSDVIDVLFDKFIVTNAGNCISTNTFNWIVSVRDVVLESFEKSIFAMDLEKTKKSIIQLFRHAGEIHLELGREYSSPLDQMVTATVMDIYSIFNVFSTDNDVFLYQGVLHVSSISFFIEHYFKISPKFDYLSERIGRNEVPVAISVDKALLGL